MLTTTFSLTAVSYKLTNSLYPVSPPTPVVNNLLLSKESWQLTLIGRAACGGGPQRARRRTGRRSWCRRGGRTVAAFLADYGRPEASHALSGVPLDEDDPWGNRGLLREARAVCSRYCGVCLAQTPPCQDTVTISLFSTPFCLSHYWFPFGSLRYFHSRSFVASCQLHAVNQGDRKKLMISRRDSTTL